jgi:hypothetical protein
MTQLPGGIEREGRHAPGPEMWWGESWYLDFVDRTGDLAGYCRLGLYPNQGAAWFWFHVVRPGQPTVQIRDHGVPWPPTPDLGAASGAVEELRVTGTGPANPARGGADGWHAALAPTADGWNVTVDGIARSLRDPRLAYGDERGQDVSLSASLDWHGRGPVFEYGVTTRYEQTSRIRGRLSVDGQDWDVDAVGQRDHSFGVRDWTHPHLWSSGTLDDGWAYHLVYLPEPDFTIGYLLSPDDDLHPVTHASITPGIDGDSLAATTTMRMETATEQLELTASPTGHAPVALASSDGRGSRFPRSPLSIATGDGRGGWGWIEYNLPAGDASAFDT